MNTNISVSVITVTYNCADLIEKNIESVAKYGQHCEHIIVDNNSKDGTQELLNKHIEKLKLILNNKNQGFTKANNQGIEIANGKYIFLLNPDAAITENTIQNLVSAFESSEQIGAVAPVLLNPDGSIQNYTRTFPKPFALFVESFVPKKYWNKFESYRKYTCFGMDFNENQPVEQPAGAAILFENNRKLDETYFIYVSDVDLCKSIVTESKRIIQTPTATVIHNQSKGGTGTANLVVRMYLDLDNSFGMRYFFGKFKQKKDLVLYNALFFFGLLFTAIISIFSDKRRVKFQRFVGFLKSKNFRHFEL
jgi:GT2 family glycosyltransferase